MIDHHGNRTELYLGEGKHVIRIEYFQRSLTGKFEFDLRPVRFG